MIIMQVLFVLILLWCCDLVSMASNWALRDHYKAANELGGDDLEQCMRKLNKWDNSLHIAVERSRYYNVYSIVEVFRKLDYLANRYVHVLISNLNLTSLSRQVANKILLFNELAIGRMLHAQRPGAAGEACAHREAVKILKIFFIV